MNNCPAPLRRVLPALAFALACGEASALALGEIHSVSQVGERLYAQVNVISQPDEHIEAGCVHFRKPAAGEGPWLDGGSFSIRDEHGTIVLDVRSAEFIREPVLRIGLAVGCGYGIERDYRLNLKSRGLEQGSAPLVIREQEEAVVSSRPVGHAAALRRHEEKRIAQKPKDHVVVSMVEAEVGDPGLRLARDLQSWQGDEEREARRELLRMEYRLLQAFHEQIGSQLDAAEKLRQMEDAVGELRKTTGNFSERSEASPVAAVVAAPVEPALQAINEKNKKSALLEWGLFGLVAALLLALGGFMLWRNSERRRVAKSRAWARAPVVTSGPAQEIDEFDDPPRSGAFHADEGASVAEKPLPVLTEESPNEIDEAQIASAQAAMVSTTVHEHYQVNPVMELADIMLSFGRVKGAAQALQEFIDHNPEEALQPWIRLMDVYRMAGMRSEFERVAADLNQHFNVEIQLWDNGTAHRDDGMSASESAPAEPLPIQWPQGVPKAKSIEEMEHVRTRVVQLWPTPECADYLNQLLRNNRGGLRTGLALPVVGEIMFLLDLLKSRSDLESEVAPPG